MILAIDFDGTIAEHRPGNIGNLKKDALRIINQLYKEGHYIIIWTTRTGERLAEMIEFLNEIKLKYHKINENAPWKMILSKPSPKIHADIYIDDHCINGVPEWDEIYKIING